MTYPYKLNSKLKDSSELPELFPLKKPKIKK